jgi:hypothetical protein
MFRVAQYENFYAIVEELLKPLADNMFSTIIE